MANKGWLYTATTEQRLEQIKAGIELGMTSKQVAMNCGCYYADRITSGGDSGGSLVRRFANRHGLTFPKRKTSAGLSRISSALRFHKLRRLHDTGVVDVDPFNIFGAETEPQPFELLDMIGGAE